MTATLHEHPVRNMVKAGLMVGTTSAMPRCMIAFAYFISYQSHMLHWRMQELLGVQPKWFNAGAKDYGFPPLALLSLEFLLLGFLELKRYQGFKKTGKVCIASP